MNVSKLKQMLVAIVAIAPLLLVGEKAFGANALGIKNAVYASQVNCLDDSHAIIENSGLCAFYGKILDTFSPPVFGADNFTIPFQPYDEWGNEDGPPLTIYVGDNSGQWVSDHLNMSYDLLSIGKNKRGSIIAKLTLNPAGGNFYAVASSAAYGQMPFGTSDAFYGDGTDSKDVAMWRAFTTSFNNLREVSAHHVWHNGDFEIDINRSPLMLNKLTIMTQKVYSVPMFGSYTWAIKEYVTTYTTNGLTWTTLTSTSMPADYSLAGDGTIYNTLDPNLCTYSNPCIGSKGLYMLTLSNGTKIHIGTKIFTENQLAGLAHPEVDKIPCPFAAYAIESGKAALMKAMQNQWRFKFNYVNGTNTNVGNFSGKKWMIGRVVTEITEFYEPNDPTYHLYGDLITDTNYPNDGNKNLILMGIGTGNPNNNVGSDVGPWATIKYNNVNCACFEIYY